MQLFLKEALGERETKREGETERENDNMRMYSWKGDFSLRPFLFLNILNIILF